MIGRRPHPPAKNIEAPTAAGIMPAISLRGPGSGGLARLAFDRQRPGTLYGLFDIAVGPRSGQGWAISSDGGLSWSVPISVAPVAVTRYLVPDPKNSQVLYGDGGKSFDGGQTWIDANTGVAGLHPFFTVAPNNTNKLLTGGFRQLYGSNDGAQTWTPIGLPPFRDGEVYELTNLYQDPYDDDSFYFLTKDDDRFIGFPSCTRTIVGPEGSSPTCGFVTHNRGASWIDVTPALSSTGVLTYYTNPWSLAFAPGVVYAALRGVVDGNGRYGGVVKSLDGGLSWLPASGGLPLEPDPSYGVTLYPLITGVEPATGRVDDPNTFYTVARRASGSDSLYLTRNGGTSWSVITPTVESPLTYQRIVEIRSQAGLAAGQDTLYVVAERRFRHNNARLAFQSGIFASSDGGASWRRADGGLSSQTFTSLFDGPDGLYGLVADVGPVRSLDRGATWSVAYPTLVTATYSINSLVHESATTVWAGTSNGGKGILRSTDGGLNFTGVNFGLGNNDASILAVLPGPPAVQLARAAGTLWRRVEGVNSGAWTSVPSGAGIVKVLHAPGEPGTFYGIAFGFSGSAAAMKSTDAGASWTQIAADNSDIFLPDPNFPGRIFKSTYPGNSANAARLGFETSDDGGETWIDYELSTAYAPGRRLLGLLPTSPAMLFSAVSEQSGANPQLAQVDYSIDQGRNWIPLGRFSTGLFHGLAGPAGGGTALFGGVDFVVGRHPVSTFFVRDPRAGLWAVDFTAAQADPVPPTIAFAQTDYRYAEAAGVVPITIALSSALAFTSTVNWTSAAGSALPLSDFSPTSGVATFGPGETTAVFTTSLISDSIFEPEEQATFSLSEPSFGLVGLLGVGSAATLTIVESAAPPACVDGQGLELEPFVAPSLYLPMAVRGVGQDIDPPSGASPPILPSGRRKASANCTVGAAAPITASLATVNVTVLNAPAGDVRLTVSAPDLAAPIVRSLPVQNGQAVDSITLPTGRLREIVAEAGGRSVRGYFAAPTASPQPIVLTLATAPTVDCSALALSATSAPPGKPVTIVGLTTTLSPTVSLNGQPAAARVRPDGRVWFAAPLSPHLPAGTRAALSIALGGALINCPLPAFEILTLPPAPGETARMAGELSGLFGALAARAEAAGSPDAPLVNSLRQVHYMIQGDLQRGAYTSPNGDFDALLAQAGIRDLIRAARLEVGQSQAPSRAALDHSRYRGAEDILKDQRTLEMLLAALDGPAFKILKGGVELVLGVVALATIATGVAAPVGVTVGLLTAFVFDKLFKIFTTALSYQVILVRSTPPAKLEMTVGETPLRWDGGAIDVERGSFELTVFKVADEVLGDVATIAGVAGKEAYLAVREVVGASVEFAVGLFMKVLDGADGTRFEIPTKKLVVQGYVEQNVPLLTLGKRSVDAPDVLSVSTGSPNLLVACRDGRATVSVEADGALAFKAGLPPSARTASFAIDVRQSPAGPSGNGACGRFVQLAGGGSHSLGLTSEGLVYAWGANNFGQLGDGTTTSRSEPRPVPLPTSVVQVAAGQEFSLALDANGIVWAWGRNQSGQLGVGDRTNRTTPVASATNTYGLISSIAAGERHALAVLRADGRVLGWGWGGYGQLGNGRREDMVAPIHVQTLGDPASNSRLVGRAASLAAGRTHSFALLEDGRLFGWGFNAFGQIGNSSRVDATTPVRVSTGGVAEFRQIAAGGLHSLAITTNGVAYAWGWNKFGQVGDGTANSQGYTYPHSVVFASGTVTNTRTQWPAAVSAGASHSLILLSDGRVLSAGNGEFGRLGYLAGVVAYFTAVTAGGITSFSAIGAGNAHSLAQATGGAGWAWGRNDAGQLGVSGGDRSEPVQFR
ncbi:MAG: Calx-beta domain-containing protein [Dehalococcoidia bacterium]